MAHVSINLDSESLGDITVSASTGFTAVIADEERHHIRKTAISSLNKAFRALSIDEIEEVK